MYDLAVIKPLINDNDYLQQECKKLARQRKLYNDTYDHQKGDNCLQQIARKICCVIIKESSLFLWTLFCLRALFFI